MNKLVLLIVLKAFHFIILAQEDTILIEAESFIDKGGWVVDQRFMD